MATRLYVYGKDDLGINTATLNYSGQPYLEDFSYFRNKKYMTQELLDALDRYDALYETKKGIWKELNDEYYDLLRQYSEAVVVPERSKSLLDELEFEVKSLTRLSQIQASGSSTEKLDTLKETFKDYNEQIIHYLDANGAVQEKKIVELLEDLGETITGIEGEVVDISKAIKAINDSFEYKFDIMEQALQNDINLDDYSLNQLEEALRVYNARIDVLNNISKNIISADINSELTTGKVWAEGDRIYYRLIEEDTDEGIANTVFDNFDNPYTLSNTTSEGYFEFNLPSEYTKVIRNNDDYRLELWLAKKLSDGKYDDRVLQTENVHYYVMETDNTSGAIYKIRQNSIDLTIIKNALEEAIEKKKVVVEEIKSLQDENAKKTNELKLSLNKATAQDEQGLIFTEALIRELNRFIIEKEYTNENIGVADINTDIQTSKYKERVDELYQDGMTVFYSKSTPLVEFNIDIVNFMRDIRYQKDWDKISLGDMIHIMHSDASKKDYIVRITQIQWNPTDNFLQLTLSNEDKLTSSQGFMEKMIRKINSTATTVNVQKEKWNNAQSNAVEEILNTEWNKGLESLTEKTDITMNDYGITTASVLDKNKQTRLNGNMLLFTDDNWNHIKTAISNGRVVADTLAGKQIISKTMQVVCPNPDGGDKLFTFDEKGAKYHNAGISVTSDGEGTGNGVTIGTEPDEGVMVTRKDGKGRIVLNANEGLYCQKATTPFNWKETNKTTKMEMDGSMTLGGNLHAKTLTLQEIGGENIVNYINRKTNSYTRTNEYTPDATEVKLGGEFLEGRGLEACDNYNNLRVKIDGNTGALEMYNGYILMEDDDGSSLQIDPQDFLTWIVKGQKKFWYDKANNALKFGGTIDTRENAIVGAELTVGAQNENPVIHLHGMNQDICTISCDGGGDKQTLIDSAGHLLLRGSMGVYLNNADSDNRVVTKGELDELKKAIDDIKQHLGI